MAEIINLNRFRKAKAKVDARVEAEQNRVRHGRTKAEKDALRQQADKAARELDGKHRED